MISDWKKTSEAAMILSISGKTLLKLRKNGVLLSKKHYRKKNPTAARPTYLWNIETCGEALGHEPKIRYPR